MRDYSYVPLVIVIMVYMQANNIIVLRNNGDDYKVFRERHEGGEDQ
jgi:hypothetical protein